MTTAEGAAVITPAQVSAAIDCLDADGHKDVAALLRDIEARRPIRYPSGPNTTTWLCLLDDTDDAELCLLQILVTALAWGDSQGADQSTRLRVLRYLRDRTRAEPRPPFVGVVARGGLAYPVGAQS